MRSHPVFFNFTVSIRLTDRRARRVEALLRPRMPASGRAGGRGRAGRAGGRPKAGPGSVKACSPPGGDRTVEVQLSTSRWEAGIFWSLLAMVLLSPWPLGSDRPLPASLLAAATG